MELELRIEKRGNVFVAVDKSGNEYIKSDGPRQIMMQLAYENNQILYQAGEKWRRRAMDSSEVTVSLSAKAADATEPVNAGIIDPTKLPEDIMKFIHDAPKFRPKTIIVDDLKWKFLIRSIVRGKNVMMTGPAGSGKTQTAIAAAKALGRPMSYFNLGATQDPKSYLIGNTHYEKDKGTIFRDSAFIKAIETENSVILLDELSRAHPEAWNILMTVLDPNLRSLRIDEDPNTPVITVAEGVSFIATANIGNEYTATRVMDRALLDRFVIFEMDVLTKSQESALIKMVYPGLKGNPVVDSIVTMADMFRNELKSATPQISTAISTRVVLELASLIIDEFSFQEAVECTVYPFYSKEGGTASELTFVKMCVQKFINSATTKATLA